MKFDETYDIGRRSQPANDAIHRAAEALRSAGGKAFALTGAGVSTASGIPDFRSPGGLWTTYKPSEVATDTALRKNPKGVWEFLLAVGKVFDAAKPNPAHFALADLERAGALLGVVTQNIDGLHQAAGSERVVEYHGGNGRWYCNNCGKDYHPERVRQATAADIPLTCDDCGGVIRPSIVFFGEGIPADAAAQAEELVKSSEVALIVGSSGEVGPANSLPRLVQMRGGLVIEVNLGETEYRDVSDIRIDAPVETTLPRLVELLSN